MQIDCLLSNLASPAQRALQNANITTLEQLSAYSEAEIMALHGIGKHALISIKAMLEEYGLTFANGGDMIGR